MKKIKIIPKIVLILGFINLFIAYNNIQQKGIKDLGLKIAILNEELTSQIKELESEISMLKEITTLNRYHEDLTDLTFFESFKFEEFRNNYDNEVLNGLTPISICKMYLHASLIKDYESQYEFYTTNENGWFWTKEEDEMIPSSDRISDFSIFEDIYNLNMILMVIIKNLR